MNQLFKRVLSFETLIARATAMDESQDAGTCCLGQTLKKALEQTPIFSRPIPDPGILVEHQEIVRRLMSLVFPPVFSDSEMVAAFIPFSDQAIYASPWFRENFLDPKLKVRQGLDIDAEFLAKARRISAYLFVLETFYGIVKKLDFPIVLKLPDRTTSFERYYSLHTDFSFVRVKALSPPEPLTPEQKSIVLHHLDQPEKLMEMIPPSNFEFQGFTILRTIDVTVPEIMSALERDLIDEQALISKQGFLKIQERLRTLFQCKDLIASISALQGDRVLLLNSGSDMLNHCIFKDSSHVPITAFKDTPWEKAALGHRIVLVPDILDLPRFNEKKESLFPEFVRSLMVVPMLFEGECIGTFSLGSPQPGEMSSLDTLRASLLQPLFAMAIKKALNDLHHQVQRIIKENCTAIHPSVEWRFHKAAVNHLTALQKGQETDFESIVFKEVYSLFGTSDIRGSTRARNRAVQEDLSAQLTLALEIIESAEDSSALFILQELRQHIHRFMASVAEGPDTGAEINIIGFLQQELEPLFPHLNSMGTAIREAVTRYTEALDPDTKCIYDSRKDFEQSVTRLNRSLAEFLQKEEASIQSLIPHYFEMHRTDGIDYLIYAGQALMETGSFNRIFLKNLRLWQIRLAAGIARLSHHMAATLKTPLETAHLVLIQDTPLSIRFRYDEKRFDVDGAYDTRQEIIKSRLDKAIVKGTGERVTQPGKIAIVYSRHSEAAEIHRHIRFLVSTGHLVNALEEIELEGLLDVQGLKAIRVAVNLESDLSDISPGR